MKIAAVVNNMSTSQNVFYMTKCFNNMLADDIAPTCFYLNLSTLTIWPQFSHTNIYYASGFFNGIMIATCLETANIVGELNNKCEKYLYLWDMEWLYEARDYLETVELLNKFNLIARSYTHAQQIFKYSGKKCDVIEDWNYEKVKELVEKFYARQST